MGQGGGGRIIEGRIEYDWREGSKEKGIGRKRMGKIER